MSAAFLAVMLAAAPAGATPQIMEKLQPAFAGTIVSTYDDGRTGHLNLASNGTYRYRGRTNKPSSGVWAVKGSRVCLKQRKPLIPFASYCTPIPKGKTWTAKAAGGERITLRVVGGAG